MNAKKCDRCDLFYVPTYKGRVFVINKHNFALDLCPKCYNDLLTFMANPDMAPVHFKCKEEKKSDIE